jgi:hydroxymethylpyrimidine/phosphomethylpyrimidine kinase
MTKRDNVNPAVLRLPCEVAEKNFLSLLKLMLVKELIKKHGMSQTKVAEILGVTQPAISMHFKSENRVGASELMKYRDIINDFIEKLAEGIAQNKANQMETMHEICGLCILFRRDGPICKIHKATVPSLGNELCSFCLTDLASEKRKTLEELHVLDNVRKAVRLLEENREFVSLIPEIGSNVAMAKEDASTVNDVAGVQGKIHIVGNMPKAASEPEFGEHDHLTNAILTMMKYKKSVRAAINVRFDWPILDICKAMKLKTTFFDRKEEPPEIKNVDGKTIPWGISKSVEKFGKIPDVIYDFGDVGKEPMLFIFGETAYDVANLAIDIAKKYYKVATG